jgi:hypothetical protein
VLSSELAASTCLLLVGKGGVLAYNVAVDVGGTFTDVIVFDRASTK